MKLQDYMQAKLAPFPGHHSGFHRFQYQFSLYGRAWELARPGGDNLLLAGALPVIQGCSHLQSLIDCTSILQVIKDWRWEQDGTEAVVLLHAYCETSSVADSITCRVSTETATTGRATQLHVH